MADATGTRDLLPAWALDAVDDAERARVEEAVRDDPGLAREARALVETAARLAAGVAAAPPPDLRAHVLTSVEVIPQRSAEAPSRDAAPRPRRLSRVALWIAAGAVMTMAVIAPTVLAVQQAGRAARAEGHVALFAEALGRPGALVIAGEVTGGGQAVAVLTEEGTVFSARGLSPLAPELGYQLWVIGEEEPVSAGVLDVAGGTATVEVVGAAPTESLALTVEPAEGSAQPTTDPLVVLPPEEPAPEAPAAEG